MVEGADALSVTCRCGSWVGAVNAGWRHNRRRVKQPYRCRLCRRRSVVDDGFLRMGHRPGTITKALDLYFSGLGSGKVVQYLGRHHGVRVARWTVITWTRRFGRRVCDFLQCLPVHPHGRNPYCGEKRP